MFRKWRILGAAVVGAGLMAGMAQGRPLLPPSISSASGQFIVHSGLSREMGLSAAAARTNGLVFLNPALLAVSCERIKHRLLWQLDMPDRWKGPIHLYLHNDQGKDGRAQITSIRFADGWFYRVDLPITVDTNRYVRCLVQVLLQELANRGAGVRAAEVPLWLQEGFTQIILSGNNLEPVVLLPMSSYVDATRMRPPLDAARILLREHAMLTFSNLCFPSPELFGSKPAPIYQTSAHLLLYELLHLRYGRPLMRRFIALLPRYLNWQTAFLKVYHPYFRRLLDVEKWWAVKWVDFTSRNGANRWTRAKALAKLSQILRCPVAVYRKRHQPPKREELALQQALTIFPMSVQRVWLQRKIDQLNHLRFRSGVAVIPLVLRYQRALQNYLDQRLHVGTAAVRRGVPARNLNALINRTRGELNALDRVRARMEKGSGGGDLPAARRRRVARSSENENARMGVVP